MKEPFLYKIRTDVPKIGVHHKILGSTKVLFTMVGYNRVWEWVHFHSMAKGRDTSTFPICECGQQYGYEESNPKVCVPMYQKCTHTPSYALTHLHTPYTLAYPTKPMLLRVVHNTPLPFEFPSKQKIIHLSASFGNLVKVPRSIRDCK